MAALASTRTTSARRCLPATPFKRSFWQDEAIKANRSVCMTFVITVKAKWRYNERAKTEMRRKMMFSPEQRGRVFAFLKAMDDRLFLFFFF